MGKKWVKKLFRQICYFLDGKFPYVVMLLKGQRVILIKWESFGAF
jgi:hypothetical protein